MRLNWKKLPTHLSHSIVIELLWWLSFSTILIVFAALFVWQKFRIALAEKRMRQITSLQLYRQRLQMITSELLSQANELDQNSKYLAGEVSAVWSNKLGIACDELVKLTETLPLIEQLLDGKNIRQSEEGILQSCRMATKISRELHEIKLAEPKLLGDKKSNWRANQIPLYKQKKDDTSESR